MVSERDEHSHRTGIPISAGVQCSHRNGKTDSGGSVFAAQRQLFEVNILTCTEPFHKMDRDTDSQICLL